MMVVLVAPPTPACTARAHLLAAAVVPAINFSLRRDRVTELVLRASEEYGFFRVINHGVPGGIVAKMEARAAEFFALTLVEKQQYGPPDPLGYGRRDIGFSGDTGELEYLLLHTNPSSISQSAKTICRNDQFLFSSAVNEYVEAMKDLACQILDMLGEGLGLEDKRAFSKLVRDSESDSLVRFNHYPSNFCGNGGCRKGCLSCGKDERSSGGGRIGFGEHSDPQLLSLLRSNDVEGLQILAASPEGEVWVPVLPDPNAFFVSIGDLLQAFTNGRLVSVRHRAIANSCHSRMSTVYFGGPPLQTWISPHPETITLEAPRRYKSFTWAEYKKAMYTLRLGYNRLDLFHVTAQAEEADLIR